MTTLTLGRYRVLSPLGEGGMGRVFLAEDPVLGRRLAVKVLPEEFAHDADRRERLLHEARAASALNHPNIVVVHDAGETDGRLWIAMERIEGETLRTWATPRKSPAEILKVVRQAVKALAVAHEAGLVHRDLKPGNLFLARVDDEEVVKVLDFGIVKETGGQNETGGNIAGEVTATGEVLGSPHYMSPEQVRGDKDIDYRSDLWSLGVILFRIVTGELPFPGDKLGPVISKILVDPISRATQIAPDLPSAIDDFFVRALARDRALRFQSVDEMLDELGRIAGAPPRAASMPDTLLADLWTRAGMASAPGPGGTLPISSARGGAAAPGTLTGAGVATPAERDRVIRPPKRSRLAAALAFGAATMTVSAVVALVMLRAGSSREGEGSPEANGAATVPEQAATPPRPVAPIGPIEAPAQPATEASGSASAEGDPAAVAPGVPPVAAAPATATSTAGPPPATTSKATGAAKGGPTSAPASQAPAGAAQPKPPSKGTWF
jgi:serine/threonine-protein kinase